jgi:hypothetical protein
VVTRGPSSLSSNCRQASWSLSARSAGSDDQHLIAPEPLGQHLISLGRAAPAGRSSHGGEGQPATWRLGQLRRQLICRLTTTGWLP